MALASLGIDFGVRSALNLWVAAIQGPEKGTAELWQYVYHEQRPDLGVVKLVSEQAVTRVGTGVGALLLPWTNYDRMESLWLWNVWLDGGGVCALPLRSEPVVRVALGTSQARPVRPALSVASGELDMCLILGGGKQLAMVRFTPGGDGRRASGSVLWHTPLTAAPVSERAALGPEAAGSPRRVVLVRQDEGDVVVELLDLAGEKTPAKSTTARLPGHFSIPAAEPGIRIDAQGNTFVSLLIAANQELTEISVADLVFPAGRDKPPSQEVTPVRTLDAAPVAAAIAFQSRPDRPMRRDWVVLNSNGTLVHSQSNGSPMQPQGNPVTPLELVALSQATYVLTLPGDRPMLEALQ